MERVLRILSSLPPVVGLAQVGTGEPDCLRRLQGSSLSELPQHVHLCRTPEAGLPGCGLVGS